MSAEKNFQKKFNCQRKTLISKRNIPPTIDSDCYICPGRIVSVSNVRQNQNPAFTAELNFKNKNGGEWEIRTLGTLSTHTRFPIVLLKPLGQLSVTPNNISFKKIIVKKFYFLNPKTHSQVERLTQKIYCYIIREKLIQKNFITEEKLCVEL